VRKTIAEGLYWDLDFENCFPVILYHTCKHYGQPTPVLERIVKDREKLLSEIMAFFSCTRKAAKQLVLKHIHGGKLNRKWFDAFGVPSANRLKHAEEPLHLIREMEDESELVRDFFLGKFPKFTNLLTDINQRRIACGQTPKDEWSALAHGLQTLEDKLLQHLETFLVQLDYQVDSYEFDGLKPRRNDQTGAFPRYILDDAQDYLASRDLGDGLKIPMRIEEKSLECPYGLA
jgi:hypothetical protein